MDLRDFLSRLDGVKAKGDGEYICKCPAHDDRTASLCVREGDKGIVLKCQAGCPTESVLNRMGLKMADLFRERAPGKGGKNTARPQSAPAPSGNPEPKASEPKPNNGAIEFVCAYDYRDENGNLLFQACRYIDSATGKKTFRLRQPDPGSRGGWKYSKKGARMVLYRLPELLAAIREGRPVFIVEGEKDADNLARIGRTATTNAMGAGKWTDEYGKSFEGADRVYTLSQRPDHGHERPVARAYLRNRIH